VPSNQTNHSTTKETASSNAQPTTSATTTKETA
jgi:hypothetical protein